MVGEAVKPWGSEAVRRWCRPVALLFMLINRVLFECWLYTTQKSINYVLLECSFHSEAVTMSKDPDDLEDPQDPDDPEDLDDPKDPSDPLDLNTI